MELFLTPGIASQLIYSLGLLIALAYLFSLRGKTRDTWLVIGVLSPWFFNNAVTAIYEATHTHLLQTGPGYTAGPISALMVQIAGLVAPVAVLLFVYRLRFRFARTEEAFVLSGVIVYATWLLYLQVSYLGEPNLAVNAARSVTEFNLYAVGWAITVGLRKWWKSRNSAPDAGTSKLMAMAVLSIVFLELGTLTGSYLSVVWPLSAELRGLIPGLASLMIVGLLVPGYLLYGEEEHSLQAKLVGFLLIAYVFIVTIILPTVLTEVNLRRTFEPPVEHASLLFQPDSTGGYRVVRTPHSWIDPAGEDYITSDDGAVMVPSAFPFLFYGKVYDRIWAGTNGSLSFGAELDADNTFSSGLSLFDSIPSIAVFYADFIQAGRSARIVIDPAPDRYLVTWVDASLYDLHESTMSIQAALYPNGQIELNYQTFMTVPLLSYVGISPGGPAEPVEFTRGAIANTNGQPAVVENIVAGNVGRTMGLTAAPNASIIEYTDNRLAYSRSVNPRVLPFLLVAILGFFVTLFAGMAFYRGGLLRPLGKVLSGLRSVESGNLDVRVDIAERNELGALSDHFNEMTASLREYSDRMEDLVAQRTADLDATIKNLRATQQQLIEQEKLASLGSLTAGIAHEIKNPLNFVNNFAEVNTELADELAEAVRSGDEKQVAAIIGDLRNNAEQIAKHGKRADSIVRSMMQHARGGVSEMEEVDMNVYLEEYINLAWHGKRAQSGDFQAEIDRDFGKGVGTASVRPQELGRVVLNLLGNAFDALRNTENACVRVSTSRSGDEIKICFADNGPGIPPEIRERIFEPFFTTKATGEGTGLGLSLSYDIITNGHNGTMSVRTGPEGGAEFVITLPAKP